MTDRDYRAELEEWFESAPDWIEWKEIDITPHFTKLYESGEMVPKLLPGTATIHVLGQAQVDFTK